MKKDDYFVRKLRYNLNYLKESLLSFFLPALCEYCGRKLKHADRLLCNECKNALKKEMFYPNFCLKCHKPMEQEIYKKYKICYFCKTHDLLFRQSVSLGGFSGKLKILIKNLKYHGNKKAGVFLGKLLAKKLAKFPLYANVDYIIPVPLHEKKLKIRGYNQSRIIADSLAWHWPFDKKVKVINIIKRVKFTKTQTKLNYEKRQKNTKNAFECTNSDIINGKGVLIIDDVLTTGATINECIKTILPYNPKIVLAAAPVRAGVYDN